MSGTVVTEIYTQEYLPKNNDYLDTKLDDTVRPIYKVGERLLDIFNVCQLCSKNTIAASGGFNIRVITLEPREGDRF